TTLFSLFILLDDCELAALSCSLSGYAASRLHGMSGIVESSRQKRLSSTTC
ncbi:hypothetical protein A2U01_0034303, partial [Trifolium medium]|nr:hypothetical protein [Trifolium medium]